MRVALVHDYIKEYGGAERVLRTLADIYPKAPIYTAFSVKGSTCEKEFRDRKIMESWLAPLLRIWRLYSPLRFLTPLIWKTMDLSSYDLVITSASWYITRGFKVGQNTKIICYCHTPPRWLYGYEMSVGFTKYWPVKVYAAIVGHFMRIYDFKVSQPTSLKLRGSSKQSFRGGVDYFIANSINVKKRIEKFYRRDSVVIYPPVDVEKIVKVASELHTRHPELDSGSASRKIPDQVRNDKYKEYFLIVSRLVGAKGLEQAAKAAKELDFKLKIVGEAHGFADVERKLRKLSGGNVELLGRVSDDELYQLYGKARGFIALAREEDFGMTVVEAQAAGTPVIAFNGGGFKESVIDGKTGILINDTDEKTLEKAIRRFNKIEWDEKVLQNNAKRFSKKRFEREIRNYVDSRMQ